MPSFDKHHTKPCSDVNIWGRNLVKLKILALLIKHAYTLHILHYQVHECVWGHCKDVTWIGYRLHSRSCILVDSQKRAHFGIAGATTILCKIVGTLYTWNVIPAPWIWIGTVQHPLVGVNRTGFGARCLCGLLIGWFLLLLLVVVAAGDDLLLFWRFSCFLCSW